MTQSSCSLAPFAIATQSAEVSPHFLFIASNTPASSQLAEARQLAAKRIVASLTTATCVAVA